MRTSSAQTCGEASRRWAVWGNVIWSPDGSMTRCRPTGELSPLVIEALSTRSTGTATVSSCFRTQVNESCGAMMHWAQVLPYHASYGAKDRTALRLSAPRAGRARLDPVARLAPHHGVRVGQRPMD